MERGAGDPTEVAATQDGRFLVTLAGVNELAIGRPEQGMWTRVAVARRPTALVVDEKNFARLHLLKTGRAVGQSWQVLDGLKPGDKVITEGLAKVAPDMPVAPQPAGRPQQPANPAAR